MAYIKTLKDNELIGGQDNTDVYPISTTQALYSHDDLGNVRMSKTNPNKPEKLEERLTNHEENIEKLHHNFERVPNIVNEILADTKIVNIEGDVTNAADEEDLTSVNVGGTDVLKFKDKAYSPLTYSGLGRMYLRKNIVNGVNVLTQKMLPNANTIYIIQYDYDLDGEEITIPEGCVLEFDGGSLSNGTINLNNAELHGDVNITAEPAWNEQDERYEDYKPKNKKLNVSWFGAKGDGVTDDSFALRRAIRWLRKDGATLIFDSRATYLMGDGIADEEKDPDKTLHTGYSYDGTYIFQGTEFDNMSGFQKKKYIEDHPNNIGREITLVFFKFNNLTIEGNNCTLLSHPNNGICRHNVLFIMCACKGCAVNNLTLDDNSFNRVNPNLKFIFTDGKKFPSVHLITSNYDIYNSYYAVMHRDRGSWSGVQWGDLDYAADYGAIKTAYISDVRDSNFLNFNSVHAVRSCCDIQGTFEYRKPQGLVFDSCRFEYAFYHVVTTEALFGVTFNSCTIQYGGLNEDLTDSEYAWNTCTTLDLESDYRRIDGQIEFLKFYNCKFGRSHSAHNHVILNIEAHDILFDRCVFDHVHLNSVPCVGGYNNEVAYCTFINCLPAFRQEGIYIHHNYIYYDDVKEDLFLYIQTKVIDYSRTYSSGFLYKFSVTLNDGYSFKSWLDSNTDEIRYLPIYTIPEYIVSDSDDNEYTSENGIVTIDGTTVAKLTKQQNGTPLLTSVIPTRVEYNIFKFDYSEPLDNTKHVGLLKGTDNLHFRNNTIINAHNSNVNTLTITFFDNNRFIQEKEKYPWLIMPSFINDIFPATEAAIKNNEGCKFKYAERTYSTELGMHVFKFYVPFANKEINLDEIFTGNMDYMASFNIYVKSTKNEVIFRHVGNGQGSWNAYNLIVERVNNGKDFNLYYTRTRPMTGGCLIGGIDTAYIEIQTFTELLTTSTFPVNRRDIQTYTAATNVSSTIDEPLQNSGVRNYALGSMFYIPANQLIHYNSVGMKYVAFDGAAYNVLRSGNTASRPLSSDIYTGFIYTDTEVGKSIYWNGTKWVDTKGMTAGVHRGNTEYRGGMPIGTLTEADWYGALDSTPEFSGFKNGVAQTQGNSAGTGTPHAIYFDRIRGKFLFESEDPNIPGNYLYWEKWVGSTYTPFVNPAHGTIYKENNNYWKYIAPKTNATLKLDPATDIGYEYFDTDLGKMVYAKSIADDGTASWVDANGMSC